MAIERTLTVMLTKLRYHFDFDQLQARVAAKFQGRIVGATLKKSRKKNSSVATIRVCTYLAKREVKAINILISAGEKFDCGEKVTVSIPNPAGQNGKTSNLREFSESLANTFHSLVANNVELLERCADREEMGVIFQAFLAKHDQAYQSRAVRQRRQIEGLVMAHLRKLKLMRSHRYGDNVIMVIAGRLGSGDFPPIEVRQTARERVLTRKADEEKNKCGVQISHSCTDDLLIKPGRLVELMFTISSENRMTKLKEILIQGTGHRAYTVMAMNFPMQIAHQHQIAVQVKATGIGVYRATLKMMFENETESFSISRFLTIKSGDAEMEDILKPVSEYKRKARREYAAPEEVIPPPTKNYVGKNQFANLPKHGIPKEVRSLINARELENIIERPDGSLGSYEAFWRNIIWVCEFQAEVDVKSFDMDETRLKKDGRLYTVEVPGLAEGRPSVSRGDLVKVTWKGKEYHGRVEQTRLLDVMMEFDKSFASTFNTTLDRVHVRFTFSRTTFRTMHEGSIRAEEELGQAMLAPTYEHVVEIRRHRLTREMPPNLFWANRDLNDEQKLAVTNIIRGECRPLPFIIFGPPGTGKTTTVAEAVYQLAKHKSKPKILIVAPSNDAADNLVEKLSAFFPPSEMRRILAYTRSLEQHSPSTRAYASEGLSNDALAAEIQSSQLVVSTVNLAARFSLFGVPREHFEVLVVDEAGHATEPEIIAVAATLMNFTRRDKKVGQLILAGDPCQLGPVVTSNLCLRFGLAVSYMERLTNCEIYGKNRSNHLLTRLVRNYRSHPAILKLPNEMFYDGDLIPSGQALATHDMSRWKHLPKQAFPLLFHAVYGENLREGNSPSWFNPQEAQEVLHYVDLLINHSYPAVAEKDIGIITPYNRQAQKIRKLLQTKNISNIKVGSVETFQGQERRCIIVSTVRAESEYIASDLKYNLGFVANEKRFNVAMTRAKSLVIVIGHPAVLALDKKNWLPFLQYCKEHGGWLGEAWEEDYVLVPDDESNSRSIDGESDYDWDFVDGPSVKVVEDGLAYINYEL